MHTILLGLTAPDGINAAADAASVAVHIDNARFAGTREQVDAAAERFLTRCAAVGLVLNEELSNRAHTCGVFCGVAYDYDRGLVGLSSKTLRKLRDIAPASSARTAHDWESDFGLLAWAAQVKQHRYTVAQYPALSAYRRIAHSLERGVLRPDSSVVIDPSATAGFDAVLLALMEATPHRPRAPGVGDDEIDMFVDASLVGGGVVVIVDGCAHSHGYAFPADVPRNISVLEAMTIGHGAEHFAKLLSGRNVHVWIDNDSARYAADKGFAKSEGVHAAATASATTLEGIIGAGCSWRISRVPTELNPSDAPSRGSAADLAEALITLDALRRADSAGGSARAPRGWRHFAG